MANEPPLCYTPRQLRIAYGVEPLIDRGVNGRGRTVVILAHLDQNSSFDATVIQDDLAHFDKRFDLPPAALEVVSSPESGPSALAVAPETVLDAETVHAIAPRTRLRLVVVEGAAQNNGAAAEERALTEAVGTDSGDIISVTAGGAEACFGRTSIARLHAILRRARDRHITVLASSGDLGAVAEPCGLLNPESKRGVQLPASDPLVTAVGGTELRIDRGTGGYRGETVWYSPSVREPAGNNAYSESSGGGFSMLYSRPAYQANVRRIGAWRGVPDVAADAASPTAPAVVFYFHGREVVLSLGGTSAAASLWAGVVALADQYADRRLGFINPALYRIGRSSRYRAAFHDITHGDNRTLFSAHRVWGYPASSGWDPVTGWGSPNAAVLVPLLARYVRPRDGGAN